MYFILGLVAVIICMLFLGYLYLEFIEKNSEEPEVTRKWSDPKFRDD